MSNPYDSYAAFGMTQAEIRAEDDERAEAAGVNDEPADFDDIRSEDFDFVIEEA